MGLKLMYVGRHLSRLSAKRVAVIWHVSLLSAKRVAAVWHVSRLSTKRVAVVWRVSRLSAKFYGSFVLWPLIFFSFLDERKEGKRKSRR